MSTRAVYLGVLRRVLRPVSPHVSARGGANKCHVLITLMSGRDSIAISANHHVDAETVVIKLRHHREGWGDWMKFIGDVPCSNINILPRYFVLVLAAGE